MMEGAIYFLLRKYFRREIYYIDLVEHFLDVTFKTCMGQMVDLLVRDPDFLSMAACAHGPPLFQTAPEHKIDLSQFSLEQYVYYLPRIQAISAPPLTEGALPAAIAKTSSTKPPTTPSTSPSPSPSASATFPPPAPSLSPAPSSSLWANISKSRTTT